jgi:hypothetical protein
MTTGNGPFLFPDLVAYGGSYYLFVASQPSGQTCTFGSGSAHAQMVSSNIGSITVVCNVNSYVVGGQISGLPANSQVTLMNNGGDALVLTGNGSFTFVNPVAYGGGYAVSIGTQPTGVGVLCSVANGIGVMGQGNVNNVSIQCVPSHPVGSSVFNGTYSVTTSYTTTNPTSSGVKNDTGTFNGACTSPSQCLLQVSSSQYGIFSGYPAQAISNAQNGYIISGLSLNATNNLFFSCGPIPWSVSGASPIKYSGNGALQFSGVTASTSFSATQGTCTLVIQQY